MSRLCRVCGRSLGHLSLPHWCNPKVVYVPWWLIWAFLASFVYMTATVLIDTRAIEVPEQNGVERSHA
jgi:hypothetical protein